MPPATPILNDGKVTTGGQPGRAVAASLNPAPERYTRRPSWVHLAR